MNRCTLEQVANHPWLKQSMVQLARTSWVDTAVEGAGAAAEDTGMGRYGLVVELNDTGDEVVRHCQGMHHCLTSSRHLSSSTISHCHSPIFDAVFVHAFSMSAPRGWARDPRESYKVFQVILSIAGYAQHIYCGRRAQESRARHCKRSLAGRDPKVPVRTVAHWG